MTALDRFNANPLNRHILSKIAGGIAVLTVAASALAAPSAHAAVFDGDTPNSHFLQHTAERVNNQIDSMQKLDSALHRNASLHDPRIPGPVKARMIVDEMNAVLAKAPNEELGEMDNSFMRLPDSVAPNSTVSIVTTALNVEKRYLFKATSLVELVADGYRTGDRRMAAQATSDLDELLREYRVADQPVGKVIQRGIADMRASEPDIAPEPSYQEAAGPTPGD